jgi:hypothetical protein
MGWPDAEDLLAGPRGRRLCWSLLNPGDCRERDRVWDGAYAGDLTGLTNELAVCVARTDPDSALARAAELTLLAALVQSVDAARYWQEPDDEDHALAAQEVRELLLPLAQAVTTAPGARWWPSPIARDGQQYVEWPDERGSPPVLRGPAPRSPPGGLRRLTMSGRPGSGRRSPLRLGAATGGRRGARGCS